MQPDPTTAELQAALALFAWVGWPLERALADPLRSRLLKARARAIRARQIQRTASPQWTTVRRLNPHTGQYATQHVRTGYDTTNPALDLTIDPTP